LLEKIAAVLPNPKKLIVIQFKLSLITKSDFLGLDELKRIEIRDNNIESIDLGAFVNAPKLEHLDFSTNGVKFLSAGNFPMFNV
jgi:Leucine-rich repeat (LRR) protein